MQLYLAHFLSALCTYIIDDQPPASWDWLPNIVLPFLGIIIVLFCLGSFVFPYGKSFPNSTQVFKGYGVDLEISLLTVVLLIGVLLSFAGTAIYLYASSRGLSDLTMQINQLSQKLAKAEADKEAAADVARSAGRFVVYASIQPPPNISLLGLDVSKLQCRYIVAGREMATRSISRGITLKDLTCPIDDVGRADVVQELELVEADNGKVLGVAENIYPLLPKVDLHPPE